MSQADFFDADARQRAAHAVRAVEAATSAEVVVAVRRQSGDYRVVAYHFGLMSGSLVVLALLLSPRVYPVGLIALEGLVAFTLGFAACRLLGPLSRALTRKKVLQANTELAARAAFYDLGVSRTAQRNGILVFVSTFERRVSVLADVGIDRDALEPDWGRICSDMDAAARHLVPERLFAALEGLAPVLGAAMPRRADDVNELPDEVQ